MISVKEKKNYQDRHIESNTLEENINLQKKQALNI